MFSNYIEKFYDIKSQIVYNNISIFYILGKHWLQLRSCIIMLQNRQNDSFAYSSRHIYDEKKTDI